MQRLLCSHGRHRRNRRNVAQFGAIRRNSAQFGAIRANGATRAKGRNSAQKGATLRNMAQHGATRRIYKEQKYHMDNGLEFNAKHILGFYQKYQ
jgi:hypothetical protein